MEEYCEVTRLAVQREKPHQLGGRGSCVLESKVTAWWRYLTCWYSARQATVSVPRMAGAPSFLGIGRGAVE